MTSQTVGRRRVFQREPWAKLFLECLYHYRESPEDDGHIAIEISDQTSHDQLEILAQPNTSCGFIYEVDDSSAYANDESRVETADSRESGCGTALSHPPARKFLRKFGSANWLEVIRFNDAPDADGAAEVRTDGTNTVVFLMNKENGHLENGTYCFHQDGSMSFHSRIEWDQVEWGGIHHSFIAVRDFAANSRGTTLREGTKIYEARLRDRIKPDIESHQIIDFPVYKSLNSMPFSDLLSRPPRTH